MRSSTSASVYAASRRWPPSAMGPYISCVRRNASSVTSTITLRPSSGWGTRAQVAEPFETDQHRGDTPRGQAERGSQLAGGGRPLRHEDLHAPEVGAVDAQPLCGELVESVDAGLVGLHLLGQLGLEFVAT